MQIQYLVEARPFANTWERQHATSKDAFRNLLAHYKVPCPVEAVDVVDLTVSLDEVAVEEVAVVRRKRPYCCNSCCNSCC